MMQPLWESLVKWSYPVTSNATPRCIPKRSESTDPSKHMYTDVHSSRIHHRQSCKWPEGPSPDAGGDVVQPHGGM